MRLLMTVRTPETWAASAAAWVRAASVETFPLSVATPLWTVELMEPLPREASAAIRLCTAAVRLASSGGGVLLHPLKARTAARVMGAKAERLEKSVERRCMEPLSCK
jgi:hypothetical protein